MHDDEKMPRGADEHEIKKEIAPASTSAQPAQVPCVRELGSARLATEPAPVRQILEHVGERTSAPVIAPARSPPLAMNGQQLAAPEWVFEAIPELGLTRR